MTLRELNNHVAIDELAEKLNGQPIPNLRMTEKEFLEWCRYQEGIKAEWVDGEVIVMAPASGEHVDLDGWLYRLVSEFVEIRELGIVRGPEFAARFASRRRLRVPDLMFISKARMKLLKPNHLEGAPDLIMEIVSPDSETRDRREKYVDYEAVGVREYWIIDPLTETVELYVLGRNKKYRRILAIDDKLKSQVLRGFYVREEWLWRRPLPKLARVL
jgi:Uma2 family endonuclease